MTPARVFTPAFDERVFRTLPLLVMTAAAAGCLARGVGWSERVAAVPWLVSLAVTALVGSTTAPLFSVELSFVVWHGWRQMRLLAPVVAGAAPSDARSLVASLAAYLVVTPSHDLLIDYRLRRSAGRTAHGISSPLSPSCAARSQSCWA